VSIAARQLRKSYNGVEVLRGIDLHIEPGETLVVIGGSGQGKSVLLRHLAGLEKPDSGSVHLSGIALPDYLAMDPDEKPFRMSMVFQGSALLNSLTVAENVSLRMREHGRQSEAEIQKIVAGCLAQVDLAGTEDKLPADLSGGMRKRVAIARALAADPQVIFHDEPTADLDPILTEQIGELILRIQRTHHATQVVVTHNLALACEVGDRIAVLHRGQLVDVLPPSRLSQSTCDYTKEFLRAASLRILRPS
jgi:phospholipid/cholesterol/gamma-HCH transport system ATP-binding protein